jgi:putative oxidoreductase
LSNVEAFAQSWAPRLLSVLRIIVGLLFLEHGTSKILGFPATGEGGSFELFSLHGLSGVLELVGGALMTLGLFTRATAFILSGEMAVAYFIAHAPHGFFPLLNHGEPAIFYCFTFLYLAAAGAGPWSIDSRR